MQDPALNLPLDIPQLLAIAAALGFVSGIRLYLVLLVVGSAGFFGWMHLPAGLQLLSHPLVLICLGVLSMVEFLADKLPWLDSAWDAVHTFIRLPAGAALAAALAGGQSDAVNLALGLVGGTFAATSHFAKASTRAVVNGSPEPFSNIALSFSEDVLAAGLAWLTVAYPWLAGVLAVIGLVLAVLVLRFMWRGLKAVLQQVRNLASLRPIQGRKEVST